MRVFRKCVSERMFFQIISLRDSEMIELNVVRKLPTIGLEISYDPLRGRNFTIAFGFCCARKKRPRSRTKLPVCATFRSRNYRGRMNRSYKRGGSVYGKRGARTRKGQSKRKTWTKVHLHAISLGGGPPIAAF